jgi:diaminopimelate decarboxylase
MGEGCELDKPNALNNHVSSISNNCMKQTLLLETLITQYTSPLHILFPQNMEENIAEFQKVFATYGIRGHIFYAHKANRSTALIRHICSQHVGVDVSSESELQHVLANGFRGNKIIANGPKNPTFLKHAIENDVVIAVDSEDELWQIIQFAGKKVQILIRVNGFTTEGVKIKSHDSRFGIPLTRLTEIYDLLLQHKDKIAFLGFSFHIDTSLDREKHIAIGAIAQEIIASKKRGLQPRVMNIGGGFKVSYLEKKADWEAFLTYIQHCVMNGIEYSWNGHSYGYYQQEGRLRGSLTYYDHYNAVTKGDHLRSLLTIDIPELGTTFAQFLNDVMIDLYIEPGRSLLDQIGITVSKVVFTKQSTHGEILVGLDMNYKQLGGEQEMLIDPLVISQDNNQQQSEVYFVGNLCLENDVIFKRKIALSCLPKAGDIVVFINTAAYSMDFSTAPFIHYDLPKRIIAVEKNNNFYFCEDEEYEVLTS